MISLRATAMAALVLTGCVAAASGDSALIVNSGSTNASGYKIVVSPDGKGTLTPQNRAGTVTGSAKSFAISAAAAKRLFADLAAAKAANLTAAACMKSASFGTTTHVTWQGWTSPDLDCPPSGDVGAALMKDIEEVQRASGATAMPLTHT